LTSDEEFDVIKRLGDLPQVIHRAADEYEPSVIAVYTLELAMAFNGFLARHRVLGEDERITAARVLLTQGVKNVLSTCLNILGMEVLERM
jgi:arginyl-tRNA synthetase